MADEQAHQDVGAARHVSYRGYNIDLSAAPDEARAAAIEGSIKKQIDLVESLPLKPELLDAFRRLPIIVTPGIGMFTRYTVGVGVEVGLKPLPEDRPTLLHEYLHVFHMEMLPQGLENPDIIYFYDRAKTGQIYPAEAYLLKEPAEFFAMTASAFLMGKIARAPFTRENLEKKQPRYAQYLASLFEPAS
jgi:hypothetical protein